MVTKLFLISHRNPRHGNPSPRDEDALVRVAKTLRAASPLIAHAAYARCEPAKQMLEDALASAQIRLTASSIEDGLPASDGGRHSMPCCDDPVLVGLLARLPRKVRPSASTLLFLDPKKASMLGARALWCMKAWMKAHREGVGLMTVHPLVLELALWSMGNQSLRRPVRAPSLFALEIMTSSHVLTFPGKVVYVPHRHRP